MSGDPSRNHTETVENIREAGSSLRICAVPIWMPFRWPTIHLGLGNKRGQDLRILGMVLLLIAKVVRIGSK